MFLNKKMIYKNVIKYNNIKYNKQLNLILYFLGHKFKYNNVIKIAIVLNSIFGIGYKKYVKFFITSLGFSFNFTILYISVFVFQKFQLIIRNLFLNFDLKKYINSNILFQKKIKSYSGYRHILFLPVRGQRTKTNAGTQKRKRFILKKK